MPAAPARHTCDREVLIPLSSGVAVPWAHPSVRRGREAPARGTCLVPWVFTQAFSRGPGRRREECQGEAAGASSPRGVSPAWPAELGVG